MVNWLHIHDLLGAQITRRFPSDDLRPFTREVRAARGDWPVIKQMLLDNHAHTRTVVEAALLQFVREGDWPEQLSAKEKLWVSARLANAKRVALRLSVPFDEAGITVQPHGRSQAEVLEWLLFMQWEALGILDWLQDLSELWPARARCAGGPAAPPPARPDAGPGFAA